MRIFLQRRLRQNTTFRGGIFVFEKHFLLTDTIFFYNISCRGIIMKKIYFDEIDSTQIFAKEKAKSTFIG